MATQKKKGSRNTHFLIGSFSLLLIISIGAFVYLGQNMSKVSAESIGTVG